MTRIPLTYKKLREAQFFYRKLSKKEGALLWSEEFDFYLSAFLSASRSITFVIQFEQKEAYDAWFPDWKETLEQSDKELLSYMNNQRVAEIHHKGAEISRIVEETPIWVIPQPDLGHPAYGFHWFAPPGTPPPTVERVFHHFQLEGSTTEAVATCGKYLALLEKLVREFDQAQPST